jgi:hypothetical protein
MGQTATSQRTYWANRGTCQAPLRLWACHTASSSINHTHGGLSAATPASMPNTSERFISRHHSRHFVMVVMPDKEKQARGSLPFRAEGEKVVLAAHSLSLDSGGAVQWQCRTHPLRVPGVVALEMAARQQTSHTHHPIQVRTLEREEAIGGWHQPVHFLSTLQHNRVCHP